MSFAALGGSALVVALVGGVVALLQARSTSRTERYKIAEARLTHLEERSDLLQAEEVDTAKRILDAVKVENTDLRVQLADVKVEVQRLRRALEAAGVITP